ncbi:PAS domain S-box protein [Hyphomicrobium sp.]|uniref:PAS domain-containing sensor histidine kinase n=1 Tax=Hyphomicrobium sp. TaxID=82 RepID=UPI002B989A5E|nr:PAS domain S-box protein [Hyphomicrobium sp.]HRN87781.1 PAS domain S-box protein [Hyphomicrobium sp.]HRQ27767.1 PAS domain S-box protein [Hyphomicrobium sp.]
MAETPRPDPKRDPHEDLRIAESQISAILTIAADAIISLDQRFRITLFNEGATAVFGYTPDEIIGHPLERLIPERFRAIHPRHVADFDAASVAARKMGERQEIFALRKDGTEFAAEASIAKHQVGGKKIYMVVLRDVTERKRTEAALALANTQLEKRIAARTRDLEAEIRRREETQAALIQSQRMEAFGQLTGGVAHDFNNLLTIVTGNLELLAAEIQNESASTYLKRATDAADMGAALTKRLLTFARRRRLTPQVVDVNELVLGLTEMLKRSLGEPITLTTILAGKLWRTRADPSELENAILNLALNARDAMPSGGQLVIETRNVSTSDAVCPSVLATGDYVLISATDTGEGMAPEVLEKAFEPFFTTKEQGRGTGLGLSTIYGFAEQSGGHATITSVPSMGTTVSLYLPRADSPAEAVPAAGPSVSIPLSENAETILVVEDNPNVRELTLQRVEGLGYVVQEAENGPDAIRLLKESDHIDLVLSDIMMTGGMSGYDLARWIKTEMLHIRVVLTTGYAAEEAQQDPAGLVDAPILHKPYARADLATTLHTALHANTEPG